MSECIYKLQNEEQQLIEEQPKKTSQNQKRYKSQHPGNLPPSYSTFNTKNTTLNINNINGNKILHKGYLKHHALWGKPKNFEVTDELMFPLGLIKPDDCALKKPNIPLHFKQNVDMEKFKQYLENKPKRPKSAGQKPKQIDYFKKDTFGKVPEYLEKMKNDKLEKQRLEEEEIRRKKKEKEEQKIKKGDVFKIMQQLLQKKEELLKEFAQYSHKRDMTQQTKLRKEELEKRLNQMDGDIKKLERLYNH
ncbi:unnamed protein product [Paramecium primaurelia]|uniref:Enkurin domain-containing protein n=1 Tax=Paramecium primaurelia TaxID=5886 RepID=A0A8S1PJN9_PARPR|nr:unnamed protein product [Paramecium primaurelia]